MDNSKQSHVICNQAVVGRCYEPIYEIFQTLLLCKRVKQQELADAVCMDKGHISRIIHGLTIPNLNLRLKIANFFGVDSSIIWRYQDISYINDLIKKSSPGDKNEKR